MGIHTRTERARKLMRSKTALTAVSLSSVAALVAVMAAAGSSAAIAAAPNKASLVDSALYSQTMAGTNPEDNKLKVTVGKALSITAKPDGTPTLRALVLNSQVSGKGSGTLRIPVGTDKVVDTSGFAGLTTENNSVVYDINSDGPEVQNLHASAGIFKGEDAVSLKINAWLNGKPIDANDLYDVTGDVKLEYVFTNNTVKTETITYKNTAGATVSEKVELPAPMAASFATTFGNGWADIDAPWALSGISPAGQSVTGSAILFAPLGNAVTTLPVTLRAERATLPASTTQAVPMNLETYSGGAILSLPGKGATASDKIAGLAGTTEQKLGFYQQMLGKYASVVQEIDAKMVNPLVKKADSIKIDPDKLARDVDLAAEGVTLAADYVKLNAVLASFDSALTNGLHYVVDGIGKEAGSASESLAKVNAVLAKELTPLEQTIAAYTTKVGQLQTALNLLGPDVVKACTLMQATNTATQGVGANGLDSSPQLQGLAAALADQGAQVNALPLTTDQPNMRAAVAQCPQDMAYLTTLSNSLVNEGSDVLQVLNDLLDVLNKLSGPGQLLPKTSNALADLSKAAPGISARLYNTNCPGTLAEVVRQGRGSCGASQLFSLVAIANRDAAKGIDDNLVPAVQELKRYIPGVDRTIKEVVGLINVLGGTVDAIPGLLEGAANKLGGSLPFISKAGGAATTLGDKLAITNASLVIMNERGQAGDAVPYGNATGAGNPTTLAAWQIATSAATPVYTKALIQSVIALVLFAIAAGVGTVMYLRRPS